MKNSILIFIALIGLTACSGSTTDVAVGNKTTIEIEPFYNAGEVLKGEKIEAKFHLKNTGDYPLMVASISGSCTCTVVEEPDGPINPGETFELTAVVDTEKTGAGEISKGVTILANTEPHQSVVLVKATVLQNK